LQLNSLNFGIIFLPNKVVKEYIMSQNTRNPQSEGQENSNRGSGNHVRNLIEGFEGMNYEQIRQPYNSQQAEDNDGVGTDSGEGKRRDEP